MAKMHPEQLSNEVRFDPGLSAEVALYDALERSLGEGFEVLHSVAWVAPTEDKRPVKDGEADFVIAHRDHGFLVLEVKGGVIDYDPQENRWTSTSRSGFVSKISDPFKQAMKSCHGLAKRLKPLLSQGGHLGLFHAAVFPGCRVDPGQLPGRTSPELVIDAGEMLNLEAAVLCAFAYSRNGADLRGPSFDEVMICLRKLQGQRLKGWRDMALEIAEHQARFDQLTESQERALDMLASNRRLLIRGCAGSGKTFLAKRLARRRALAGERVLLMCFNNLLGEELKVELEGLSTAEAGNFHLICQRLAIQAGIDLPDQHNDPTRFYEFLTEAALQAVAANPSLKFDTVIIDEAQDFDIDWWVVVQEFLRDQGSSLAVFTDANQLLYDREASIPKDLGPFASADLADNVRNTQAIHREAMRFFEGGGLPTAIGPEGVNPSWIEAEGLDGAKSELERVLARVIGEQRVDPADVVILTPKGVTSTALSQLGEVGEWKLSAYDLREPGEIGWSTVRKFKGLESPVVVIVELDGALADSDRLRELLYVGVTRARDYLYVIGEKRGLRALGK